MSHYSDPNYDAVPPGGYLSDEELAEIWERQQGKKEDPMSALLDVWPAAQDAATFGPFNKKQMTQNLAKLFSDWRSDKSEKIVLVAENGKIITFTSGDKNSVRVAGSVIIQRLAQEGLTLNQVTDVFHNHHGRGQDFSPTDLALGRSLQKLGINARVHLYYPEIQRIITLEESPEEKE